MNRYLQIRDAKKSSVQGLVAHKTQCRNFAVQLVEGLIEHFETPYRNVGVFNLRQGFNPRYPCSVARAMSLKSDGFWHFGLALSLASSPGHAEPFFFEMLLRKVAGGFKLRIRNEGVEVRMALSTRAPTPTVYKEMQRIIHTERKN